MSNRKKKRINQKQILFLFVFICFLVAGSFYYLDLKRISHLKSAEFLNPQGVAYTKLFLEIADTPDKRRTGLMYRQELPLDQGMLFKFDETEIHSIWMKNTYVSLDLLFLNSNLKILGIIEKVPVLNEVSRKIDQPSKYVIELNAGTSEKRGIKVGDTLKLQP